ncbi:MAG: hypothetical protein SVR04_15800, partial [Spirochaetota bacterium]|nr:hypothetical protein [Spirochaetota bacterium]
MFITFQRDRAHTPQEFPERRIARKVSSQHKGIDKKTYKVFYFQTLSSRYRNTDRNILLARIP